MPNLATVGQKIAREKEKQRAAARYQKENRNAANRALALVKQVNGAADDLETSISDLLANIRHLCDLKGFEFHELDRAGYRHYSAEVVQARTGVEQ